MRGYQPGQGSGDDAMKKPSGAPGSGNIGLDDTNSFDNRLYVVPVPDVCTSRKYYDLMNFFGAEGGFDLIVRALGSGPGTDSPSLKSAATLTRMMNEPWRVYHKDYIPTFAETLATGIK